MKRLHIIGSPSVDYNVNKPDIRLFIEKAIGSPEQAKVTYCHADEVIYVANPEGAKIIDCVNNTDLADYDLVWFRGKLSNSINEVTVIGNYLKFKNIPSVNSFYRHHMAVGKLAQMFNLSRNNLPIPKTVSGDNNYLPQYIEKFLDYPLILKDRHGAHGYHNYLVKNERELKEILKSNPGIRFMAQEYIRSEGDYRILFAGDKCLIIHRMGKEGSHLNNTTQGATAKLIKLEDFPAEIIAEARKVADLCRYEISGVDAIIDKQSGQHYFLEANSQPQLGDGAFVAEKQVFIGDYFRAMLDLNS